MNTFSKFVAGTGIVVSSYGLISCDTQVGNANVAIERNATASMGPTAVGVTGVIKGELIRILTKNQSIQCIEGNARILAQKGDPINISKISEGFAELRQGDQITMHVEKLSGDVIIRQGKEVLAVLRKGDATRKLEEFNGFYPEGTDYCNADYGKDGILMK